MGKQNQQQIALIEKERQAVSLALAGATFDAIAKQLDYATPSGAWRAVQRALKRTIQPAADEYRQMDLMRLDILLLGLWAKAAKGDATAVDRALKILERRAKLLGLDAPVKFSMQKVVADVAAELGMTPEETAETLRDVEAMLAGKVTT